MSEKNFVQNFKANFFEYTNEKCTGQTKGFDEFMRNLIGSSIWCYIRCRNIFHKCGKLHLFSSETLSRTRVKDVEFHTQVKDIEIYYFSRIKEHISSKYGFNCNVIKIPTFHWTMNP
jgi:hypothetical protein